MASAGQQFNLRWNNHTNNFLQVFLEQFTSQTLVDVTISCQGQFLKAHKMVLSACSPYFQELFQLHSGQNPVIIMNKMKFNDVKMIIEFMYRGEIKVLEKDIDSLLEVAEALQVKGLCNVRNKYEKGDIQNTDQSDQATKEEASRHEESTPVAGTRRKKRKMSHTINELANEPMISESTNGLSDMKNDDDLPTEIKVEPPDIKDIDDEANVDWDQSRLVIDEPEETRQGPTARILKRKSVRILRHPSGGSNNSNNKWSAVQSKETTSTGNLRVVDPSKLTRIPRPPNAFMIFANEWRRKLASENPRESNKDISVRLGAMWKNLTSDMKETYYTAAREADAEHKRKYPGYYYSPKEARLRKNQKDLQMGKKPKSIDAMRLVKVYMPDTQNDTPPIMLSVSQSESEENLDLEDEEVSGVGVEEEPEVDIEDENEAEAEDQQIEENSSSSDNDKSSSENSDEKTG